MVFKKRSGYGFNGYHVPVIPRAPRSVRRRGSQKKAVEDGQICAFELLAAVAGKLLLENESSVSSTAKEAKDESGIPRDAIKEQHLEGGIAPRSEFPDWAGCADSVFISEPVAVDFNSEFELKKIPHFGCNSGLERSPLRASYDFLKKVCSNLKSEIHDSKNVVSKLEGSSPHHVELCNDSIENGIERQLEIEEQQTGDLMVSNTCSSKDPVESHVNNHALVNSDSSVQLPSYSNPVPKAFFPRHGTNVKVGIRDDDENSVGCNKRSIKVRAFKPQSRIGCRRIRKLMTSKYWKAAPKLKDHELSNTNAAIRPVYSKRKIIYTGKRYQHEAPSKRRKFFDRSSTIAYYREASGESISNSPEDTKVEKSGAATILHRASGVSSSVISHPASFKSRDSHVKFSIKSIRVPELYIEVPETATVGSLKRTVMEAVTAILEGGLHVGVLLQGKKVRDDSRTLLQTGISQNGNLDSLSFTLEPSSIETSPLFPKDPPFLLPRDAHQKLIRSPACPIVDSRFSKESSNPPPMINSDNQIDKGNHELIPSPNTGVTDRALPDSKALVAVPAMSVEALSVVPMNQKTRRSELGQRRARRPFSVSEVEALVEAVEKLGTGRWRDVKLSAFDNADHRTYVDLKDKWKTLVHTANISPQQRRGEPVPQELLDRVLSAHSYWTQHQSKQHAKHQAEHFKISEAQLGADTV